MTINDEESNIELNNGTDNVFIILYLNKSFAIYYIRKKSSMDKNNVKIFQRYAIKGHRFYLGLSMFDGPKRFMECILHIFLKIDLKVTKPQTEKRGKK